MANCEPCPVSQQLFPRPMISHESLHHYWWPPITVQPAVGQQEDQFWKVHLACMRHTSTRGVGGPSSLWQRLPSNFIRDFSGLKTNWACSVGWAEQTNWRDWHAIEWSITLDTRHWWPAGLQNWATSVRTTIHPSRDPVQCWTSSTSHQDG